MFSAPGAKLCAESALHRYASISEELRGQPRLKVAFHHIGITMDPVSLKGGSRISPTCTLENVPDIDILILRAGLIDIQLASPFWQSLWQHLSLPASFFHELHRPLRGRLCCLCCRHYAQERYHQSCRIRWCASVSRCQLDNEKKWVVDGTSDGRGGAVAGMDMVAHWMKETYGMDLLT